MIEPRLLDQAESLVVLTVEERDKLADLLERVTYEAGRALILEGQRAPGLFMLLGGQLQVERTLGGVTDRTLATDIPMGEWFGQVSVIDGLPATASVVAADTVEVAYMSRADFFALLAEGDALGTRLLRALLRNLSTQLARVNDVLVDLHAQHDALARADA